MNARKRPSWDEYALRLAFQAAERSEDPYSANGACALRHDHSVVSLGYNGPPADVEIDWSDREDRLRRIIHAENNCLGYATPGEVHTIACTMLPCNGCLTIIARYRIKRIVYQNVYERDQTTLQLAKEFGIELIRLDLGLKVSDGLVTQ